MLRLILGVVLGVFVGMLVTGVVEGVGHTIFPPPPGVDLTNPATLGTVMSKIPLQAKIMVLLAWFLGVLFGASTANLVAGRRAWAGRITALALFAFSVWTMTMIVHPLWFMAAAPVGALLAAFAADKAFGRVRL